MEAALEEGDPVRKCSVEDLVFVVIANTLTLSQKFIYFLCKVDQLIIIYILSEKASECQHFLCRLQLAGADLVLELSVTIFGVGSWHATTLSLMKVTTCAFTLF